jgi:hypothetical protein
MGERLSLVASVEAMCEWLLHDDPDSAMTLLAGCTAARANLDAGRTPYLSEVIGEMERIVRNTCDSAAVQRAERQGARLALEDLIRLATDQLARWGRANQ